ncbi:MAG: hypothetical protein J3K34DRAFT_402976 [Monoraphidium minutum]|nr:MAG: hypothetical protein J3K34DRAFT_402976 [Monoraphidium minutum]
MKLRACVVLVAAVLLAATGSYAQTPIKAKTFKSVRFLTKANSPRTQSILSAGGLVTGGTPPLKLSYLTPLPISTRNQARIARAAAALPGASPQAILPGLPGFAYPFSTNETAAGDALLTLDSGFTLPNAWWRWYKNIPWPIGWTVTDAVNNTRGGMIWVYINK